MSRLPQVPESMKSPKNPEEKPVNGGDPAVTPPPEDASSAPTASEPERCPNCAILLAQNHHGAYCIVCGYPRDKQRPTRPPELDDYLVELRRGAAAGDGRGLTNLARRLGLQWGTPELKPADRGLRVQDATGPAIAVQDAVGSDKYLIVVTGEVAWSSGLLQFFEVEEAAGPPPTRVRLRREAEAQLDDKGSLRCLRSGELEVVARESTPQIRHAPPVASVPEQKPVRPDPRFPRWAIGAFVLTSGLAILAVIIALAKESPLPPGPAPASITLSPPSVVKAPATGSLEVITNCAALGHLDGLVLPESRRQRSSQLKWNNQPARAHRLKVSCEGYEDHSQNVSLREGEHTILRLMLRRR